VDELGLERNLGWYNKLSKNIVERTLDDFNKDVISRKVRFQKSKRIVEGDGVTRIVEGLI
jgi:hypothetical protein